MTSADPLHALARRLRALRKEADITQRQLAEVLSVDESASVPLISSWESTTNPRVPPEGRLEAYARFFATRRPADGMRPVKDSELTEKERADRDTLLRELLELRTAALGEGEDGLHPDDALAGDFWHFPPGQHVTIACGELPSEKREKITYADPSDPDYVQLYRYADLDTLLELYGHIRAVNPHNTVSFNIASELTAADYTTHLVSIGGVDWNAVTAELLGRIELSISQSGRPTDSEAGAFEVVEGKRTRVFKPVIREVNRRKALVEDVAHFYTGPNPFNQKRTVTICNGMFGRGTFGAARALTDEKFRDRNREYLKQRFAGAEAFSIITRVQIMNGEAVTPDWTVQHNRLHEWPGDGEVDEE